MKIERKKVSELVLEELKEMIKTGKFPPNSQLPSENELVKMFGVSRSPIREALSVLAAGGLIESRQGGRSWVREVNVAEMLKQVHFEMIKVEEVQNLLMKCAYELEMDFEPKELKKRPSNQETLEILEINQLI